MDDDNWEMDGSIELLCLQCNTHIGSTDDVQIERGLGWSSLTHGRRIRRAEMVKRHALPPGYDRLPCAFTDEDDMLPRDVHHLLVDSFLEVYNIPTNLVADRRSSAEVAKSASLILLNWLLESRDTTMLLNGWISQAESTKKNINTCDSENSTGQKCKKKLFIWYKRGYCLKPHWI